MRDISKGLGIEENGAVLTLNPRSRKWESVLMPPPEMAKDLEPGDGGGSRIFSCNGTLHLDNFSTTDYTDYLM
jgi:hypothetical protein